MASRRNRKKNKSKNNSNANQQVKTLQDDLKEIKEKEAAVETAISEENANSPENADIKQAEAAVPEQVEESVETRPDTEETQDPIQDEAEEEQMADDMPEEDNQAYYEPSNAEPLYDHTTVYNYSLMKSYEKAKEGNENGFMKYKWEIILVVIGIVLIAMKMTAGGITIAVLAPLRLLASYGMKQLSLRRQFKARQKIWNREARIRLLEDYVEISSDNKIREYAYDNLKNVYEDEGYVYIDGPSNNVIVIEKEIAGEDLCWSLVQLINDDGVETASVVE